ncbi:ATP-binding cassette domain-containing protein [Nonomuraea recticatena]|uniref:ATP-binding cassette domain-containing protein n=1 Tax=Nonomuraea recticatena TaxID=46178 RepID=UPI00362428E3
MNALLTVEDLRVSFPGKGWGARRVEVLRGVSLDIAPGETLGLVGESGSGKTTIGRAILGLVPVQSGAITFGGERLDRVKARRRRELGRDLQVIFQDPYTSLNPSRTIGDTLSEPLLGQGIGSREARLRVGRLLDRVHLPADAARRLPRSSPAGSASGGDRPRAGDRPQADRVRRTGLGARPHHPEDRPGPPAGDPGADGVAYLFISHDLAVVRFVSHRVAVIHRGEIVESGQAATVTSQPRHPYTRGLLLAAPVADVAEQRARRQAFELEYGGPNRTAER